MLTVKDKTTLCAAAALVLCFENNLVDVILVNF